MAGHIYKQTVHRTTQITTSVEECGQCSIFASFTLAFALQLRKKHRKTSVSVRKTSVRLRKISVRVQYTYFFLTHGSLHHESMLIKRSNLMQQCADIYLLQSHSTCFGASQHSSSGALKTEDWVLIRLRWKEVAVPVLWPIPEVAVTVFSAPDDGCCDTRNM